MPLEAFYEWGIPACLVAMGLMANVWAWYSARQVDAARAEARQSRPQHRGRH